MCWEKYELYDSVLIDESFGDRLEKTACTCAGRCYKLEKQLQRKPHSILFSALATIQIIRYVYVLFPYGIELALSID